MDHAGLGVKGIDRYLPTQRSKVLAFLIIPSGVSAYPFVFNGISKIFSGWTPIEQMLLTLLISLFIAFLATLGLVVELVTVSYQKSHSRIYHYTYHAPKMNIKWLISNARPKHYLFYYYCFLLGIFVASTYNKARYFVVCGRSDAHQGSRAHSYVSIRDQYVH